MGKGVRMPATCPKCERFASVDAAGRFRFHRLDDLSFCPGSGTESRPEQPPQASAAAQ